MFKKFVDGLAFGAGFSIAFIALWTVSSFIIFPAFFEAQFSDLDGSEMIVPDESESTANPNIPVGGDVPFYALSIEERIDAASAIALAKYEPSDDGRMKAVITEYLKLEPGTMVRFEIGNEYPSSSYYPTEGRNRGDGVVIFFTGSPATMQSSTSVNGDRITGLNDIPLALFREKCADDDA